MKRMILALVIVLTLAIGSPLQAQFGAGVIGPPVYLNGFAVRGGAGFPYQRPGLRVVGFASGYNSRSMFLMPYGYGFPWGWNSGWGGIPGFWGWGWNSFMPPPPVIVLPPPVVFAGNPGNTDSYDNRGTPADAGIPQRAAEEPRPIGAKPGDFVVIEPKRNFPPPGGIVPEVDRVAGRPLPALPPPNKFDPFAAPIPLKAEKREIDPAKEAARLMKLGREAFAADEYGKAGELFERAAVANPKAAEPHFLQAQASFAAGAYADAVAAIRAGLLLDPTWPAAPFDPKEPYGLNAMAFATHLVDLRKVVVANPGEPVLEFLLGYELWFIGEKVEAKKWFAAAEKGLAAPGPIALFK